MVDRIMSLLGELDKLSLDGILVSSPNNRRYLSGFTGSSGTLFISDKAKYLFTDSRYVLQASEQSKEFSLIQISRDTELGMIASEMEKLGVKRVGFEDDYLNVRSFNHQHSVINAELVPLGDLLWNKRKIKSEAEISAISKASGIAEKAYSETLKVIQPGASELDIAAELEYKMRKLGAEGFSFPTIIASGENSALPHAQPSSRKLKKGDLVVMDFGCKIEGYCSDMTRTVAVGTPQRKLTDIYNIVLEAQQKALEALKAGILARKLDSIARKHIADAGYEKYFGHGLGHGVGLDVHEAPTASPLSADVLEAGMLITIEPGIYLPGLGGVRIEDLCVVLENGYKNLVSTSKEIMIL